MVAVGCDDDEDNGTGATANNAFTAALTGASEVPPNGSAASGTATININGTTSVDYRIDVQGLTDIVGGHIHSGAAGTNGPVRVTLVPSVLPGPASGTIAQGTFTASNVNGITFDELVNEIRAGTAYVNVHTQTFPGGEIRGQLGPANQ